MSFEPALNRGSLWATQVGWSTPPIDLDSNREHAHGRPKEIAQYAKTVLDTFFLARTEFQVKSTSPTATPTSFEFTLEGAVFARSNVVQTIELFDYLAAAWELVDTRVAARSPVPDSVATVAATGDVHARSKLNAIRNQHGE